MADKKPRESAPEPRQDAVRQGASDWARQFVKHFELNFFDTSRSLPPEAPFPEFQDATIRAIVQTLLDSGMNAEAIEESIARVLVEWRTGITEWNADTNRRRFELIDKEIQETLTIAEKIELARLTSVMRAHLDSEANLPLEGARALHRKLLEKDAMDRPR